VHAGERIRVVAIDGLVLEVEPEEGGAIDYREMRNRRKGGDSDEAESAEAADASGSDEAVGASDSDDATGAEHGVTARGDGADEDPPAEPSTR
jgi:hypothetical protein